MKRWQYNFYITSRKFSISAAISSTMWTLCLLKSVSNTRCLQASQLNWSTKPWHSSGKGLHPLLDICQRTKKNRRRVLIIQNQTNLFPSIDRTQFCRCSFWYFHITNSRSLFCQTTHLNNYVSYKLHTADFPHALIFSASGHASITLFLVHCI